jgi:hypothetical protein
MSVSRCLRALVAGALVASALPAAAQNCDVFTDVLASDPICPSVQWLKNRGITTGCTATAYCPTNNVTRAQMALFMQRMGKAISPAHVGATGGFAAPAAPLNPGQFQPLCISGNVAAANHPRAVRLRGYVTVPANGPLLNMFLIVDDNPPGPWDNANTVALVVPTPSGQQNLAWASNVITLAPGTDYRFGIGLSNPAGSGGTLALGAGSCVLEGSIFNLNPDTAPFDE